MKKLLIIVRGGCVIGVHASQAMEVEVLDIDNLEDAGISRETINETVHLASEGLEDIY